MSGFGVHLLSDTPKYHIIGLIYPILSHLQIPFICDATSASHYTTRFKQFIFLNQNIESRGFEHALNMFRNLSILGLG